MGGYILHLICSEVLQAMRMRSRSASSTTTKRALVVLSLVAVVSLLLSTPSSSAPGDPPGNDDMPDLATTAEARGAVTSSQGAVARRSKMYITLSPKNPIWGVFYNNVFNTPIENPTSFTGGLCTRGKPCVKNPFEQPDCATSDPDTQWRAGYYPYVMYPVRQLARGVDVGYIAEVPVNMVAFGSIPARATLLLRAARANGKVQPFRIHLWDVKAALGCVPAPPARLVHTLVEAKVEISVVDLQVDGVKIPLGSSCRIVRPAELSLWGETNRGGYFPAKGGALGAYDGLHVGSQGPLDSPYYQQDNGRTLPASTGLTIPPFTGCTANGDDLSPLITAMASGPNNPVRVQQGAVVIPDANVDLNNLSACNQQDPPLCPTPGPDTPERPPLPAGD